MSNREEQTMEKIEVVETMAWTLKGHYGTTTEFDTYDEAVQAAVESIQEIDYSMLNPPRKAYTRAFIALRSKRRFIGGEQISVGIESDLLGFEVFRDGRVALLAEGKGGLSDEQAAALGETQRAGVA